MWRKDKFVSLIKFFPEMYALVERIPEYRKPWVDSFVL